MASEYDHLFKLMLIGDCKVGKTCIFFRYKDDTFKGEYVTSIGTEIHSKQIEVNSKKVKLHIWDATGNEKERMIFIIPQYNSMNGLIIVYDVTDRNSFEHLKDYLNWIQDYGKKVQLKCIVGNKIDDSSNRAVTVDEAKEFAAAQGCPYFEVSAKTGENVTELFTDVAKKLLPDQ